MKMNSLAKITLFICLLLLTGSANTGCANTDDAKSDAKAGTENVLIENSETDSKAMLEELNTLCDTLEKKHKNMYANISEADFLKEKDQLEKLIPNMSETDFYFGLKHLVSLVGDAHTTVFYNDSNYKHLMALPFAVGKFGDSWYLMMIDGLNAPYLGAKLNAINEVPIEEIYEKSKTIMSLENEAWAISQFSNTINFKEPLEYLGIVKKDAPIMLTIEMEDGSSTELEMIPLSERDIMSADIDTLDGSAVAQTWQSGIYRAVSLDEDNLFIQYNSCEESPELSMADFTKSIKEELGKNNYQNVIIDLRYNMGGNSDIFEPMIKMLKDAQSDKKLTFYTLIGNDTFSSAIINAVQTKDTLNSILIGSPTGGNVNHYGELKSFDLKKSPISVSYSTKYFEMIKGYEKDSLYPDTEVSQTFDDFMIGKDTVVEWILNK